MLSRNPHPDIVQPTERKLDISGEFLEAELRFPTPLSKPGKEYAAVLRENKQADRASDCTDACLHEKCENYRAAEWNREGDRGI